MLKLDKKIWNVDDISDFNIYLFNLRREDKIEWTKNIINTNKNVLAIESKDLRLISKEIKKGNYVSFLDNYDFKYHEGMIIYSYLISSIKDFKIQTHYINKLSKHIDNWAVVDSLKYSLKNNLGDYISYAYKLSTSKKTFERRIAVRILFSFIPYDEYHNDIFKIINSLYNEKEYYVNMAISWLLCEMFIKKRYSVVNFLEHNKLNKEVSLKFVSKCHDSFRISNDDKLMLNIYKVKE